MGFQRTFVLCLLLFLTSSLISISIRKSHATSNQHLPLHLHQHRHRWPSISLSSLTSRLRRHTPKPKYAFATFLSPGKDRNSTADAHTTETSSDLSDAAEDDGYYLNARVLTYQLLHSPQTRTSRKAPLPFLILTTPDLPVHKRARLTADGATIVTVDPLTSPWMQPDQERWTDVLTKLRVFQLTDYKRILYLDADTLLYGRLDDIFTFDPAAATTHATGSSKEELHDHEAALPSSYVLAGVPDTWAYEHAIPPEPNDRGEMNTGFFVCRPDAELFAYYESLLLDEANRQKLQGGAFPDQDLLNYAHRAVGNMPWVGLGRASYNLTNGEGTMGKRRGWRKSIAKVDAVGSDEEGNATALGILWNANWPTHRDIEAGARSIHTKVWEGDPSLEEGIVKNWERVRDEMRAFYWGRDEALGIELKGEGLGRG